MFEYPPRSWSLTEALVSAAFPLALLLLTGFSLWRPGRKPHLADPTVWCLIAITAYLLFRTSAAYVLRAPHQTDQQIANSICWLFWLAMPVGIIISFWKLKLQRGRISSGCAWSIPAFYFMFMAMTFEGYSTPAETAWRSQCKNNLKQIALGLHNYHDAHDSFPASALGSPPVSWRVRLLPYLDEERLYSRYDQSAAWDASPNVRLQKEIVRVYECPTDHHWQNSRAKSDLAFTAYAAPVGSRAMFDPIQPRSIRDLRDGTSNTLMLLEVCGMNIVWSEPRDVEIDKVPLGVNLPGSQPAASDSVLSSLHRGGAQVAFADGSVRFLRRDTDPSVLRRLLERDDGQPVGDF